MKLCRCPICHSHLHLDALIQDESGRELLIEVSTLPDFVAKPLLSYMSLFRPVKTDLSNNRALKLIREVKGEFKPDHVLASALVETVNKLREKRMQTSDSKPLTNHNYLKQVYVSVAAKVGNGVSTAPAKTIAAAEPQKPAVDEAWYRAQAERLLKAGQDPLKSSIGETLKSIGWGQS
ncbi:hypothetical protein [Photobacterium damselae]|uniref:hypothetical protein n=1 Tax=Photobacterium damselae TaxID=38293 RepID=UPI000D664FA1|nr:hypothetical protein [Photobacterium damselae]AWK84497.1 hypothetical protein BST98_20915 [Photobacterium damselae]